MKSISKAVRTSPRDWADVTRAYFYLLRSGWRLFVRRQKPTEWRTALKPRQVGDPMTSQEIKVAERAARWTNAAARRPVPWARCLQRSLAVAMWLESKQMKPEIQFGVRKEGGVLAAHAWVVYKGNIVNDDYLVEKEFSVLSKRSASGSVTLDDDSSLRKSQDA